MSNYSPSAMNLFPALKDEEIEKSLLYVDNSEMGATPAAGAATATTPAKPAEENSTVLYLFVALLVVLAAILVGVARKLDNVVETAKGNAPAASVPFWKNTKFRVAALLLFLVWGGFYLADNAIRLGRHARLPTNTTNSLQPRITCGQT
jgi:hypothetical protein